MRVSMRSYDIDGTISKTAPHIPDLALVKHEPVVSEELTTLDHFLHDKIPDWYYSEWDCPVKNFAEKQIDEGQSLETGYMRGCVASPCDVAGGHPVLDASCRVCDSNQANDTTYSFRTLECYSFLWDAFKEDMIPFSSSSNSQTTAAAKYVSSCDEDVISSSNILQDDMSPSENVVKRDIMDSPPDDVRAFFGHPLTRATNALNGDELDANADAEALLHEYKHISFLQGDDQKASEKLSGILDIVNDHKSETSLSTSSTEISSTLRPPHPHCPDAGHQVIDGNYENHVVEENGQGSDDMGAMTAYAEMFLSDDRLLQDYIMNAHSSENTGREATAESSTKRKPRRSSKSGQDSSLHKRDDVNENMKELGKSKTRSNVVSSSTRDLPSDVSLSSEGGSRSVYRRQRGAGVYSSPDHQFQAKGAVVTSAGIADKLSDVVATTNGLGCCPVISVDGHQVAPHRTQPAPAAVDLKKEQTNQQNIPPVSSFQHLHQTTPVISNDHSRVDKNSKNANIIVTPSSSQVITANISSASPHSSSTDSAAFIPANSHMSLGIPSSQNARTNSHVKENNYLKKALSEKIRSRQVTDENFIPMPSHHLSFVQHNGPDMEMDVKFNPLITVKQETPYLEHYDPQYAYSTELTNNMSSLTSCSELVMTPYPGNLQNVMTTCENPISHSDANNNGLTGLALDTFHHISGGATDHLSIHPHCQQSHNSPRHHQQCHINQTNSSHMTQDSLNVQSSPEQYFQMLQPLDSHSVVSGSAANYYNVYHRSPDPNLLDPGKHMIIEQYLHQQQPYGKAYTHFLNPENNYNMKSPDSGFHEPCLSPMSLATTLKDTTTNGGTKEKVKKKKQTNGSSVLMRQFSSADKTGPRSPIIQKLDCNSTGYSYFLETPISTTQRKNEDRVTYLNKSQYYGLTLNFNSHERIIKCAVVKSVIILAFREEKTMDEERKAWEFWHGRQHSYKQRILDIDTKNCQGILPQNIEELSFNAVTVKWNPMDGPVRVNIAVHCLSTDFSNQKGVKGIPLHIQIDTYEITTRENHLVHRGYCQIKAFCDKGAERKTRDEERRKAAKGKSDEFGSIPPVTKGRKKMEEVFHEPCERSEFYSMLNTSTPPVFFNPLHETTEFIHKSISLGVPTSQDEDMSSLPSKLDLPDSCNDYYSESPAKRIRIDSISNTKEQQNVLLYIKERHEAAFTALMLEAPTLRGLLRSIEFKYSIAPSKVKNFYKKSKKGILVKVDDNIVRHYSHEATFIIETNVLNDSGDYEIILIEIDPVSS